jgi:hypothetical protein
MAVVPKKPVTGKTTPAKPKAPPKPKFGELNYEFKVTARIVEVNPEEKDSEYPFVINIDLGEYEDWDRQVDGSINYINFYGKGEYEQLGAPDAWMGSLANDPTYWNTINESVMDKTLANILIQDALVYFFPDQKIKTYIRFDV